MIEINRNKKNLIHRKFIEILFRPCFDDIFKDQAQSPNRYLTFLSPLHKCHEIFLAFVLNFHSNMENFH